MQVAERIDAEVESYWRGLLDGKESEAQARYDYARRRARSLGVAYVPAEKLAKGPIDEILERLDRLASLGGVQREADVAALLGGESAPPIKLSLLLETYEALVRTDVRDMSPNQLRKWRGHKKRAVLNFISVVGDKPLTEVTRDDAMDFREWWQGRLEVEDLDSITANKEMGRIDAMVRAVDLKLRLGLTPLFAGLRFGVGNEEKREPFDSEFIQEKLLSIDALADLNAEARRVIYIMVETGMRPSEIVNLAEDTIVLDSGTPHVRVRPNGRRMKTSASKRDIPLVGVALAAAQAQPHGFPRYRDKSAGLSAVINKFLSENKLKPTEHHTLYSLRHAFEDRLTAVEAPEKLIANLMGHKYGRPRYGLGPSLEQKQKWLQKIAFEPPAVV